jgi:hypothetical protein
MGRVELVQKIVAQNPHLGRSDVEAIVDTVIQEISPEQSAGPDENSTIGFDDTKWDDTNIPTDPEKLLAHLETLMAERPELADRSLDFLPPALVQAVFEMAFDSLAKSAGTMEQTVRDSERFHAEFARRSVEIEALRADIDTRLEKLTATEQRV